MTVIAIDGPGGAGKSTVARALAERLGLEELDTGAMYRAVALFVLRKGLDLTDGAACAELAAGLRFDLGTRTIVEGDDVSEEIRSAEVNDVVSLVAAHPAVRAVLVARQRAWVDEHGGGVVEGRDITSVVLPEADVRVYLQADPEVRARRHAAEEAAAPSPDAVEAARVSIEARDRRDSTRAASPLRVVDGVAVIDSSERSVAEVVDEIVALL